MISNFNFSNFLSVRSCQSLTFEPVTGMPYDDEYLVEVADGVNLLKLAIIYGANASGKSNILFALSFFRDIMNNVPENKNEEIGYFPFLLDNSSSKKRTEMSMEFYLERAKYRLNIEFDNKRIYSEKLEFYPTIQPALLYSRTYKEETDSTNIVFGAKLELDKNSQLILMGNTINNCSVIASLGKLNLEYTKLNLVYDFFSNNKIGNVLTPNTSMDSYIKDRLEKDTDNSLKIFILKVLKASDFNISDINLEKEVVSISSEMEKIIVSSPLPQEAKNDMIGKGSVVNRKLIFEHQTDSGKFGLPENLESLGTNRYLGLAVLLKQLIRDNKIIFIDEIESSLHYEIFEYFVKLYINNSNGNSQLIFTTHDINLLDENFIRRDTVWFTHKDSCGETKILRLSSMGLRKSLSPYNAYKQGKLIDLPFTGSLYLDEEEDNDE